MDKIVYILILLPGFVAVSFARLISDLPGSSEFELTFLFFLASAASGGAVLLVADLLFRWWRQEIPLAHFLRSPCYIVGSCVVALGLGIVIALGYENSWANRTIAALLGSRYELPKPSGRSIFEQLMRVVHDDHDTSISDKEAVFMDFDSRNPAYYSQYKALRVMFKSGDRVVGYRGSWDTYLEPKQLYLSPACLGEGAN